MENAKSGIGLTVLAFAIVAVVVLAGVFGYWLYQQFEGGLLSRDFQNVKHSQAYVESTNQAMRTLITDYASTEADVLRYQNDPTTAQALKGQLAATKNQIWALAGSLDESEWATDVNIWLAAHPQG